MGVGCEKKSKNGKKRRKNKKKAVKRGGNKEKLKKKCKKAPKNCTLFFNSYTCVKIGSFLWGKISLSK
jgi:hypothetical protein